MQWSPAKKRIVLIFGVVGIPAAAICLRMLLGGRTDSSAILTFGGDCPAPKATAVIATLSSEAPENVNIVWCASFLCAWKAMEADLNKGPIALEGAPRIAASLNEAADPRPLLPDEALYVATGWNHTGVLDRIRNDVAGKFPGKVAPTFPDMAPDAFVAYAYLEASVEFTLPYFQSTWALAFTDSAGVVTKVSSFGIRFEDDYAYFQLRRQPAVLLGSRGPDRELQEYVVDLDRASQPNQIVVAMLDSKLKFAEKVARVEKAIATAAGYGLGPNDVLLVPDILWSITHRFREIEGRTLTEGPLKGQRMALAQQDIQFRLDRSGAELKSETKLLVSPIPSVYAFDRPFLVYMKKRGAPGPFFVLWVDNAELLRKWN